MQNLLISGTESAGKGVWRAASQGSILGLELCNIFSSVVDGDTEGVFVSFVDGAEVGRIAYLGDRSRFAVIQNEGSN